MTSRTNVIRRAVLTFATLLLAAAMLDAQQLEIHYVNVGWGGSVLVRGPNGTTVLLDGGDTGTSTKYVVPYLKSIGIQPSSGLDYVIGGHQHCDHIGGLDELIHSASISPVIRTRSFAAISTSDASATISSMAVISARIRSSDSSGIKVTR
jgi:beta-lactamase superfamily II metal-dependent hydrolase